MAPAREEYGGLEPHRYEPGTCMQLRLVLLICRSLRHFDFEQELSTLKLA